jgi:UDP-2,4-diacetamido-2,4,6-trideoxy-beta-L-altropyranose hydrolase
VNDATIRVALRADASRTIGMGHVKRCLALAAALRASGADTRLVTRNLGVEVGAMADQAGIASLLLPAPVSNTPALTDRVPHAAWAQVGWQVDADQSIEALSGWQPDWLLVDHYAFDARWHRYVSTRLNVHLAVIDDLADRDLGAELLIDHNLCKDHREKYSGRLPEGAAILGGPRFALLGPAYKDVASFPVQEVVRSIGIFMGGVDVDNLSGIALVACRKHAHFAGPVEIAITRAYPHAQALRALAAQWPETRVIADLPDLKDFFGRHDLQIGAGGSAAWERCRVGVPTLALTAAANQEAVLPALAALGAVALIAGPTPPNEDSIGSAVRSLLAQPLLRQELSERSCALVDGLGARRVALRLTAPSLSVRPATMDDSETMYAWRNHPTTRVMSLNPAPIAWKDHQRWLDATLKNVERCLLVASIGSSDVGVVRFDGCADDQLEVSLYLDPALHGLSLGRSMLLAGEAYVLQRRPATRGFVAAVLQRNAGSMRLFESCGYHLQQGLWHKNVRPPGTKR